jgi:hypothetical protein
MGTYYSCCSSCEHMTWPIPDRERFWTDLVSSYESRLRGYLPRARCGHDEADHIVWDVWAMAVEHEKALALREP